MGKFDWLKPKPTPEYALEVYIVPPTHAVLTVLQNGDEHYTDINGHARIIYPKGKFCTFQADAEGYQPFKFDYSFPVPSDRISIHLAPDTIPVPEPIPLPTGPIKGDWLTCREENGTLLYPSVYPTVDREYRKRIIAALKHNGYTDTFVDVAYSARNNDSVFQHPGWNYLTSDPAPFIEACEEFIANGIRPIAMVGYQKDIAPPFPLFKKQLEDFLVQTGELLSGVVAGAEAEEYWKFDEIVEVLQIASRYTNGYLGYHGGRSSWGPDGGQSTQWKPGGRQVSWWRYMKSQIPGRELVLFYQYPHFIKVGSSGFTTSDKLIIEDTTILNIEQRLGGLGIKFIASEYNYLTPEVMKRLGNLAMEHGAHGFINGGFTQ